MSTVSSGPGTLSTGLPGQAVAAGARLQVVTLPAEIDVSNDGQVLAVLTGALAGHPAVLVLDAGETCFCACAGVRALLYARDRAAAAGTQLRVVASPALRRILDLTTTAHLFATYPSLAKALATQPPPPRRETAKTWVETM